MFLLRKVKLHFYLFLVFFVAEYQNCLFFNLLFVTLIQDFTLLTLCEYEKYLSNTKGNC